jgi:hypothetical protein
MHTAIFMAKKDSLVGVAILVLTLATAGAGAQVVESPLPFDSAGRVRSVTPALVQRFGLVPPVWPVTGPFLQARLFAVSSGGSVLVAERPTGAFERYALADQDLAALRGVVDAAMSMIGSRVGEDRPDIISEPARGAFLRNQMILAAALYGPLIAAMTDDARAGTALYLISVGGSFFVLNSISKTTPITRAQNDLATDGAMRGAATAVGLLNVFGGEDIHRKTYSGIALGGAVAGSAIGYVRGRGLTDSEAHASMKFSTFGAATALGVTAALGDLEGESAERTAAGAMVAAGVTGYLLGPAYPRRAKYSVTAGDVRLLPIGALLGAAIAVTPFVENDDATLPAAAATIGGWAGILVADRAWARPYDHGSGDVTQVWLGTIAGGLLGGASIVLTDAQGAVGVGMVTLGATLGAIAGHSMASPARAGSRRALAPSASPRSGGTRLTVDPTALGFAAAGVPGQHALLSFRF